MRHRFIVNFTRLLVLVSLVGLITSSAAWAEAPLPTVNPEEIGLSQERLDRITARFKADTEKGKLVGAVALIARKGKIGYYESFGFRNKETKALMKSDSVFRIYSMSKPIVSVALMMLHEEGRVYLTDPVEQYIPAFKNQTVLVRLEKDEDTGQETLITVPAKRKMTIQDLLRHTSGLIYGWGTHPVDKMYQKAGIYPGIIAGRTQTLAEFVRRLGQIPLKNHPGDKFEYSVSVDVLGHVIEVISGMPLDQFLEERIFSPLGMKDTGFYVKEENLDRIAEFEPVINPKTGKPAPTPSFRTKPTFFSGGGGLVSTTEDYLRFSQMLLNGGQLDGVRILSPKTVRYMTSDHLGAVANANEPSYSPGYGYGFGLGFAVRLTDGMSGSPGSAGEYNWGGAAGTAFWIDPKEDLIAILMIQSFAKRVYYRMLYRALVSQAIVD